MKRYRFKEIFFFTAAAILLAACTDPSSNVEGSYITEVFGYQYGPGQHAGDIADGEENNFIGNTSGYVRLGGWGGYIIGGFVRDVENGEGCDFAVFTQGGYGNEPGIVYVMADTNGDGEPNETWYELSGSETDADYSSATGDNLDRYIRDYAVTYSKASSEGENVTWEDNKGNSGELVCEYPEESTSASWWPSDRTEDSLILSGVKLPNSKYLSGSSWVDYDRFTSGYAENYGGADLVDIDGYSANCFDISDAVDTDGNSAVLSGIRFIKIQSGVFQQAGELNEISTEVRGAVDLSTVTYIAAD